MSRKSVCMAKKMKNRRYRKTEEAILSVFFDESKKGSTLQRMAKRAGVGRSTMYIHHHAVREVLPDYERYILTEYRIFIQKRLQIKNISLKGLYFDMLTFILRRKKIFVMFLRFEDRKMLTRMLGVLEEKTRIFMRLPKETEKVLKIYKSEIIQLVFEWGKRGFSNKEIEKVLADIMYLTETARDRLMPINE